MTTPYTIPIVFGAVIVLAFLWSSARYKKISRARANRNIASFVEEFEGTSFSQDAIEAAYSDLIELTGFPVLRRDNVPKLGVLPEDFERVAGRRFSALGIADVMASRYKSFLPVWTSEDYVRLIDSVLRDRPPSHSGP